ncbi:MAG: hypothetical protein QOK28_923 [Actinomycetota bacterium]|jgi:hypothetical protein
MTGNSGQIQTRVRVGVTGHRDIDASCARLAAAIDKVLRCVHAWAAQPSPGSVTSLVVVSSLAEGADRLAAQAGLDRGASLEAVLPFTGKRFENDFASAESRAEFRSLLAQAANTKVVQAGDDEHRYRAAAELVVRRSDALIAVWNGEKTDHLAGTWPTIDYARKTGKPVFWITPDGDKITEFVGEAARPIEPADVLPFDHDGFRELRRLNSFKPRARADDDVVLQSSIGSEFDRIDQFAEWNHRRYVWITRTMFVLAASAGGAGAAQLTIWRTKAATCVELVLLVLLYALFLVGRRSAWHERWIANRFFAEWLRSAFFLSQVALDDSPAIDPPSGPATRWVTRAFEEVWSYRTSTGIDVDDIDRPRRLIRSNWIEAQREYHERAARREKRLDQRFQTATAVLFVSSVIVAILHLLGSNEELERSLGFLGIVLPISAATLGALAAQREYRQHAERYERTAAQLATLAYDAGEAKDLARLREIARSADRLMRQESLGWLGVVEPHELEIAF